MKIKNIFSFAVANMWRNKFLSSATVVIIALILFTFNIILSIHLIARTGLDQVQQKVDIILYVKDNAEPLQIEKFIEEVKAIESVKEIVYTSKEDALRNLLNKYPIAIDPFSKYSIENPLPANLNILTYTAKNHEEILAIADSNNFRNLFLSLEESSENQQIVARLIKLTESSKKILISTLVIFIIASILIVSNAITLSIFYKRNELDVMKLVGAPPAAIRGPFLIEGVSYGFSGFIISMVLLYGFLRATELDLISFSLNVEIFRFILLELVCCLFVGFVSSVLSIEKYLRFKK